MSFYDWAERINKKHRDFEGAVCDECGKNVPDLSDVIYVEDDIPLCLDCASDRLGG